MSDFQEKNGGVQDLESYLESDLGSDLGWDLGFLVAGLAGRAGSSLGQTAKPNYQSPRRAPMASFLLAKIDQ